MSSPKRSKIASFCGSGVEELARMRLENERSDRGVELASDGGGGA
jgi:hypothetical protein